MSWNRLGLDTLYALVMPTIGWLAGRRHNEHESLDALLRQVTPANLHDEWDTGPAVGKEVW